MMMRTLGAEISRRENAAGQTWWVEDVSLRFEGLDECRKTIGLGLRPVSVVLWSMWRARSVREYIPKGPCCSNRETGNKSLEEGQ